MGFESEGENIAVRMSLTSIERALTNLVQKTINYGDRKGAVPYM